MYSEQMLEKLQTEYSLFLNEEDKLKHKFILRLYKSEKSQEYAKHGFIRRYELLIHILKRIFEINPPSSGTILTCEENFDITVLIQSFVTNLFGCLDNLARIYIEEKEITNIDKFGITFFGKRKKFLRNHTSSNFQAFLASLDSWHASSIEFRDTLAHRIPLYVPPFSFKSKEDEEEFYSLNDKASSIIAFETIEQHQELVRRMENLKLPCYLYRHSFSESNRSIPYHCQLICDWKTIKTLGEKFLLELDGKL